MAFGLWIGAAGDGAYTRPDSEQMRRHTCWATHRSIRSCYRRISARPGPSTTTSSAWRSSWRTSTRSSSAAARAPSWSSPRAPWAPPTARPRSAGRSRTFRRELAEIRSRGVVIEDYDLPGLVTIDGVVDFGFAWMAWIVDPGKNALVDHPAQELTLRLADAATPGGCRRPASRGGRKVSRRSVGSSNPRSLAGSSAGRRSCPRPRGGSGACPRPTGDAGRKRRPGRWCRSGRPRDRGRSRPQWPYPPPHRRRPANEKIRNRKKRKNRKPKPPNQPPPPT